MRYALIALPLLTLMMGSHAREDAASQSAARLAQTGAAPEPVVVELFTSEGCSSCPPADAVLGVLAKRPNIVALAFHVDYWDKSGWHDKFEIREATPRQNQYVRKLHLSTAFTPQMIVDGSSSVVGSDGHAIVDALNVSHTGPVIGLDLQGDNLVAHLAGPSASAPVDVDLVTYLSTATTQIKGGENEGHKLQEYNIVRSIQRLGSWDGAQKDFTVPVSKLAHDADHAVILVQQPNQGTILAAATHEIR